MINTKVALIGILLTLCTPLSFAQNFYIGSGIGPETANVSQHARILNPSFDVIDNQNRAGKGSFLSLFGGYKWRYQQFYLAGEANLNQSTLDAYGSNSERLNNSNSSSTYKINNSYGLSVLPGFLYSDLTLFYGRLGVSRGHFIVTTSDASLSNISTMLNGFRYGIGVQQTVSTHIALRFEYDRINYQNSSFVVVDGLTSKSTTLSPTTNQFELGIVIS